MEGEEEGPPPPPRTTTLQPKLPPPRIPPRGRKTKEDVIENVSLSEITPPRNGHEGATARSASDFGSNLDTKSISSRMTDGTI